MTDFTPHLARNLAKLPPYLFARIDALKAEAKAKGADLIDVSIGDPDQPTFKHIVREGKAAVADPANHQYPSYTGKLSFRTAVAQWYQGRFGVSLDPATRQVNRDGQPVLLSAREYAVLELLMQRPGAVLSRAQIEDRLYGWGEEIESNAVSVYVHQLRKKLGADFIRSMRGVGYFLDTGKDMSA